MAKVYLKVNSLFDIIAFQFKLIHDPKVLEVSDEVNNFLYLYPPEFNDTDGNRYPSLDEVVSGGQKYIEDASIYKLVEEYDNSKLRTNYGQGLKSVLNFSDNSNSDFSFEQFVFDNPNSIISDQNTKLILYFNTSSPEHHINDRVNIFSFFGNN